MGKEMYTTMKGEAYTKCIVYLFIGVGIPFLVYQFITYHDLPMDFSTVTGTVFAVALGTIVIFLPRRNYFQFSLIDFVTGIVFLYLISRGLFAGTYLSDLFWISLFLIFLSIRVLHPIIDVRLVFYTCLLGLCLLAVQGYLQYFGILFSKNPFFDVIGPFHNPAIFGSFVSLLIVSIGAFFYSDQYHRYTKVALIACLFCLPLIILIDSRASLLALLTGIGYILFLKYSSFAKKRALKKNLLLVILTLFLIALCSWLYYKRTESAQGRLLIWKVSWNMIKAKPIEGWGSNGFSANYMHYQAAYLEKFATAKEKRIAGNNHLAFNEPIRLAVEYGIVGVCFYFGGVYYILFRFRPRQKLGITLKATMLVCIVQGLFSYPTANYGVLLWVVVLYALFINNSVIPIRCIGRPIPLRYPVRLLCILLVCFISIGMVYQGYSYRSFAQIWRKKMSYSTDKQLELLQSLSFPLQRNSKYLAFYASTLFKNGQYRECEAILKQWEKIKPVNETYILWGDCQYELHNYQESERMYKYADAMVPSRQRARVRLAIFYERIGKWEEGFLLAKQVLEEDVKVYSFETYDLHQQLRETFNIY